MKYSKITRALSISVIVTLIAAIIVFFLPIYTLAQDMPTIQIGQPITTQTVNGSMVNIPISISSKGPLPLAAFYTKGQIKDVGGIIITETKAGPIDIPNGNTGTINFTLPQDIYQRLMSRSENLTLSLEIGLSTPPLLSITLSSQIPR